MIITLDPSALFHPLFGWEVCPTKIDHRKKGTLVLSSLLEDLVPLTDRHSDMVDGSM